jgi:hypothetical protein
MLQQSMAFNGYLLAQAAIATTVAAPSGMTSGEWFALGSLFIVIGGVLYKAGIASQKAAAVEALVGGRLQELSTKMDALLDGQVEEARWKENIAGRVRVLEGEAPIHIHQRATDR